MRHLGERGMSSLFGLVMLGVMILAAAGLLAVERNEAYATRRYEDEVRLRLVARSEAERAALLFEKGGEEAGMTEAGLAEEKNGKNKLAEGVTTDGISYHVMAHFEKGTRSGERELMIAATTSMDASARRIPQMKSYMRVRAHLAPSKEGKYYVWLGWVP